MGGKEIKFEDRKYYVGSSLQGVESPFFPKLIFKEYELNIKTFLIRMIE